jgi:predicted nucleotidyltransferase
MGVFIEPPDHVCGLHPIDHYIYRDQPEGMRSQPGDLDLTLYSLRKFCRLAAQGNPSILILLWLPEYIIQTELGRGLVSIRDACISKGAVERFLGYLVSQRMRLTGERSRTVNRPELVEQFGYDTKFAMHALRLGLQGIELMTTRNLTLPIREPDLSVLRSIRSGRVSYLDAVALIEETEAKLRLLVSGCSWEPNFSSINKFMVQAHQQHWSTSETRTEPR